jgi:hypothetical protein
MGAVARKGAVVWVPLAAASAYYAVFIGRSAFSFQGRTYSALFDDSMISMQYARNFAHGHGLVWNAGEHVEGYSNFLWTLWMSLVHLVGVDDRYTSLVVMLSGGALLLATLLVVRRLCSALMPDAPLIGVLAMAMTGLFYPLVFWVLRGTEVAPAGLLVALAALLAVELRREWTVRRCWALAAVLGAAVLTRDDLVVPCVVVLAWLAWQLEDAARRRTLLMAGGTMVALIAGHEALRLAYYGDALPNTYYLKLTGLPLADRLATGGESLLYTVLYSLSAPLVLAGAALVLRRSPAVLLLASVVVAQCAYSVWVGGDAWEDVRFANRYFATAAPVLMVLAAVGVHELMKARREVVWRAAGAFALFGALLLALRIADQVPHNRLGINGEPVTQVLPPLLLLFCAAALLWKRLALLALLAVAATSADPTTYWVRHNAHDVALERAWTKVGVAVHQHTAPGTRVAYVVAGNMSYFAGRRGVDLLGKMDTVVAHEKATAIEPIRFRPGHNKWDYDHSLGGLRPQVITSLWVPTTGDLCDVDRWGYRQIAPGFYVLRGARGVDVPGLAAAISGPGSPRPPPPPACG